MPDEWLREHYAQGSIDDTLDAIEREFGFRPTRQTVYVRANRLGLHKVRECSERRRDRAERIARWSEMPEEEAWMLAHDHGQRTCDLSDEFEAEFGWALTRGQVNLFRASHGTQAHGRRSYGGRPRRPVGYEIPAKDGYVLVKVAEEPTKSMSKDNWRLKHVHVWEQAHGRPLPEGMCVYFADHDRTNYDPANLVAVPRSMVSMVNSMRDSWCDAETLGACMRIVELRMRAHGTQMEATRTCTVCGARFVPTARQREYARPPKTCPACLAAGRKAAKPRRFDRDEIRALRAEGLTLREIATRMGCHADTVRKALREAGTK